LSHGFYSKHLLLPDEDPAELELLRSSLIESYIPEDGAELLLVERIISSQWKLQRLNKLEAATIQRGPGALADLERLSRLAQQLDSAMHRAIKALREMRKEKQNPRKEQLNPNVRNEPNSQRNSMAQRNLELDRHDLGAVNDSLVNQLSRDLPQLAATAVARKSQKPLLTGALSR
jgi:hypothetical protein